MTFFMQSDTALSAAQDNPAARPQDAFFLTDANFAPNGPHVVAVNDRFAAMTADAATTVAERALSRLEAAARARQRSQLRAGLERGEAVGPVCLRETRPDGTPVLVQVHLEPLRDPGGALRNYVGIVRDVTQRPDSERMIERIIEHAPAGMVMVDAAGTIDLVNEEAVRLLGYRREQLLGMSVDRLVPGEQRSAHHRHHQAYMAAPTARRMGGQRDLQAERGDGTRIPVEIGLVPLDLNSGTYVIASIVDISERKTAEANEAWLRRELERRNEELREVVAHTNELAEEAQAANRAKTSFLATVSHELRTPLNAIHGFTELLEQEVHGPLGDSRYRDYVATLANTGREMQTLVARLLELTRAVAGEASINPTDLDAARVLRGSAERVAERVGDAGPAITVELPTQRLVAVLDRPSLKRIANELLDNAVRHGPDEGNVRVVAAPHTGGGLTLTVADDGPGMPADAATQALQAFVQPSESYTNHAAGLGIGLSLAKALATAHGGDLWIETEPGTGTAVHATLPNPDTVPAG